MHTLLSSYLLLQIGIAATLDGWMPMILLLSSFALLLHAVGGRGRRIEGSSKLASEKVMSLVLLALLLLHAASPPLLYGDSLMFPVTSIVSFVLAALLAVQMIFPSTMLERTFSASAVTFAVLLYLLVPIVSPSPRVDVFVAGQESALRLLAAQNPYATPITDPYEGQKDFGYQGMPGYPYLPGGLLLQTVGFLFPLPPPVAPSNVEAENRAATPSGDVRWISVAAMLLSAFLFRKISGSSLLPLLWLYQPRGLFVVEHAWVEPLMVAVLLLILHTKSKSVFLGILLSLKQSLLFFLVHGLLLGRRTLIKGVIVAAIIITPFYLWDPAAFEASVIDFSFGMAHRSDALTLPTRLGIALPRLWTLVVGFTVALITLSKFRSSPRPLSFLSAATITTFAMLLFGSQAFVNYYFFVGGLVLSVASLRTKKGATL